jgi:hypothetical protein
MEYTPYAPAVRALPRGLVIRTPGRAIVTGSKSPVGKNPNCGMTQSQRASGRGLHSEETRIGSIDDGPGRATPKDSSGSTFIH